MIGILLEMLPTQLAEQLMPRIPDLTDLAAYSKTKEMILQVVEHKTEFLKAVPMDIGNVENNEDQEEHESQKEWGEELCNFVPKGGGKG